MKLGSLNLENNLVLAPLQNVTTGPYRTFCRKLNTIGLVSIPMLYIKRIVSSPNSLEHELYKIQDERPISVQLIGNDQEALKGSIEFLESYEFDVLDLNAGCPSKRAIKAKEGGYLLRDLKKLEELVLNACKYSSRPVSLKIRTGFDKPVGIKNLKNLVENSGIEFLTVHARTVKDRFDDSAIDLDYIKQLKESISIPIVGNGDIFDPKTAKKFLETTNVDALMIGRGTMGNPQIFHQINDFLSNGSEANFKNSKSLMKKNIEIYDKIIDDYLEGIKLPYSPEEFKFMELKRNSIWLTKDIEHSTVIRYKLSKSKSLQQLKTTLEEYYRN